MVNICFGFIFSITGVFLITLGVSEHLNLKNYVLKTDVKKAFESVNWSKQTFVANQVVMKDKKGHDTFYSAEEIDKAIAKLNEKL